MKYSASCSQEDNALGWFTDRRNVNGMLQNPVNGLVAGIIVSVGQQNRLSLLRPRSSVGQIVHTKKTTAVDTGLEAANAGDETLNKAFNIRNTP